MGTEGLGESTSRGDSDSTGDDSDNAGGSKGELDSSISELNTGKS